MALHHPIRKTVAPEPPVIPDKLYFRIGDVSAICEVPAYVLRFWETEFPQLKPNKGGTGQRLYRKRDVEMALRIKSLLYDQGYTIPGARQVFKAEAQPKDATELAAAHVGSSGHAVAETLAQPVVAQPVSVAAHAVDIGAAIRQDAPYRDRLATIRAELQSLAELLASRPAQGGMKSPAVAEAAPARLKLMRPRIVSDVRQDARPEPRPDARPDLRTDVRPEHRHAARLMNQGDLFPVE